MRVGLLSLMAGRQAGGPETYEVELIRALGRLDRSTSYSIYHGSASAPETIGPLPGNFRFCLLRPSSRIVSLTLTLPLWLKRDGIQVLHSLFTPPPFQVTRSVFTLHGLVNFAHPEFFEPSIVRRLNALMKRGIHSADQILCVSDDARRHLLATFTVPPRRARVVHHGVSEHFAGVDASGVRTVVDQLVGSGPPYMLYAGKLQPGKNVVRLVEAFARFLARTGADTRLVLAGKRTEAMPDLDKAIASIPDRVLELGHVSAEQLPALYAGAELFAFPSLFESFGLPVLEAMAAGIPVITSDTTALPEIAGNAARFVDPLSVGSICDALVEMHCDPALRSLLAQRGRERARRFTWTRCAEATLEAYRQVAGHRHAN